jgi:hypothetical protein
MSLLVTRVHFMCLLVLPTPPHSTCVQLCCEKGDHMRIISICCLNILTTDCLPYLYSTPRGAPVSLHQRAASSLPAPCWMKSPQQSAATKPAATSFKCSPVLQNQCR